MLRPVYASLALAVITCLSLCPNGLARGNNWTITNGSGEEIKVRHGFFGRSHKEVKDRLGDKYVQKKGLFGSKETEVNILGNQLQRKKGWFGSSEIQGQDILGDSIRTKKGLFGRRTTTVDMSGVTSLLEGLFSDSKKKPVMPPMPMDKQSGATDPLTPLGDPAADMGGPPSQ